MSPCCYLSKQTGVKIIGYFYLVLILLTITFIIFLLTIFGIASAKIDFEASNFTTNGGTINKSEITSNSDLTLLFSLGFTFCLVYEIFWLLLTILLLIGAYKENRKYCMVWFIVYTFFSTLSLMWMVYKVVKHAQVEILVAGIVEMLFCGYVLWVVGSYMEELRKKSVNITSTNLKPKV